MYVCNFGILKNDLVTVEKVTQFRNIACMYSMYIL